MMEYELDMEWFLIATFIFFAAVLASFLQVVIVRTLKEKSFIMGRSACDHCQHQLAWYDNLPLLSFVYLAGKCRYCRKSISPWTWVSEVLAALWAGVLVFLYLNGQLGFSWIEFSLVFGMGLLLLFVVIADLQAMIVPDLFVGLLVVLVSIELFWRGSEPWWPILAAVAAVAFFLTLYKTASWLLRKPALGFGDVKLMVPLALSLSWPMVWMQIFLSFVIGGLVAMSLLLLGRKHFGQALPFAPFIVVAFIITKLWGLAIWNCYINLCVF